MLLVFSIFINSKFFCPHLQMVCGMITIVTIPIIRVKRFKMCVSVCISPC
jgi:hypothetical protein